MPGVFRKLELICTIQIFVITVWVPNTPFIDKECTFLGKLKKNGGWGGVMEIKGTFSFFLLGGKCKHT